MRNWLEKLHIEVPGYLGVVFYKRQPWRKGLRDKRRILIDEG